ncbi:MAG: hypothetical protein A4E35_01703 [Methanoregula sp. PtaU1.Bin051]|nr:MAG: hypothetical protein A4E35_01703 [Methanoregula sp. PtaU1.Bin051]
MPFCGECGEEYEPGDRFCARCGEPLRTPPLSFSPGDAPPPSPPPLEKVSLSQSGRPTIRSPVTRVPALPGPAVLAVFCIVIVLIAAAYFAGLIPVISGSSSGSGLFGHAETTSGTTLLPTQTTLPATTTLPVTTAPLVTQGARYEENYEQVHSVNRTFIYGEKIEFPYLLTRPPLYVKFNVTPVMVNRTKIADAGLSTEHEVYAVYPSTNAYFQVRVLSAPSRNEVERHGFGTNKGYNAITRQEFMVRTAGDYIIEMSGSDVTVEVIILIGTS